MTSRCILVLRADCDAPVVPLALSEMSPLIPTLLIFGVSTIAGVFGSLLGLGGGLIVIPSIPLLFGIDIRVAIGASIVSVIATSSGAAPAYVRVTRHFDRLCRRARDRVIASTVMSASTASSILNRVHHCRFQELLQRVESRSIPMLSIDPPYVYQRDEMHTYRARSARSLDCDGADPDVAVGTVLVLLRESTVRTTSLVPGA